jgi:ketosteroid isomerase-like protein
VDLSAFSAWLDAYFHAWVSNDPDDVTALFTEDATYQVGPFAEPWRGRDEIVGRWVEGGTLSDPVFEWEPLVLQDEVGVARWNVRWAGDAGDNQQDGVLVLRFAADGRCAEHREWYVTRERE